MEIEYAFLARAAEASPDGTLSMLGAGFEVVRSRTFPKSLPFTVVVKLKGVADKTRTMTLEFDAFREDGQSTLDAPYVLTTEMSRRQPDTSVVHEGCVNVLLGLGDFLIPAPGVYRLVLKLTGENVVGREFRLIAEETHA